MAKKTLAAELAEVTAFFEENKGIKVHGITRKDPDVYRVTTHNDQFTVTVSRSEGAVTEALISYP
jgi:hypothetical protein